MKTWSRTSTALAVVCAAQAGFIAADAGILQGTAHAQDAAASPPALTCRRFVSDLERDPELQTSDQTTEIGQWVAKQQGEGWSLDGVDFELVQKHTGFPQAYIQVCVRR